MPLKLLPWKIKRQPQNPQENLQGQVQNPKNPLNESPSQSPVNLIGQADIYSESDVYVSKFSSIFPAFTVVLYAFFIILVLYNFYLNLSLSLEKREQVNLMNSISNYKTELEIGREVDKKSEMYMDVLSRRSDFKVKLNTMIKTLPDNVDIKKIMVKDKNFEVTLEGNNVLLFARLILLYLGSDEISDISIKTASKNSRNQTYTVTLLGNFYEREQN